MSSGDATSTAVLTAPVMWAQRRDRIFLTICLEDVQDKQLDLTESRLTFTGVGGADRKPHSVTVEFFKAVDPQESRQISTGREIFISVRKLEPGPYWPRLTADAAKRHWLKTDFKRWLDEDEVLEGGDDEEFDGGPMTDLQSKLTGLAGGGGFDGGDLDLGGMGGEESEDSDDEEEAGEETAKNGCHDDEAKEAAEPVTTTGAE